MATSYFQIPFHKLGQPFLYAPIEHPDQWKIAIADELHLSSYYAIQLITSGQARQRADFQLTTLRENQATIIAPGQLHHLHYLPGTTGHLLLVEPKFYERYALAKSEQAALNLFFHFDQEIEASFETKSLQRIKHIFSCLEEEQNSTNPRFEDMVGGSLVRILTLEFMRSAKISKQSIENGLSGRRAEIVRQFFQDLNKDFRECHQVQQLALKQDLTSNFLNVVVKAETGSSAKDFIKNRLALEAKRLATITRWSMKDIATSLGFEDIAHFSRFFKKQVGTNFSKFREAPTAV
ncbi:MAG: helix-turn-helix transcriptional regulator [Bacteroidota bacterium]